MGVGAAWACGHAGARARAGVRACPRMRARVYVHARVCACACVYILCGNLLIQLKKEKYKKLYAKTMI